MHNQQIKQKIQDIDTQIAELIEHKTILLNSLQQNNTSSPIPNLQNDIPIKKIVIVGGNGQLGKLFGRLFINAGYHVVSLDKDDWPQAQQLMLNANAVIVAVPIHLTNQVLEQLKTYLSAKMLLVDLTSIKQQPLTKMLEVHTGPVLGLHPMFGPDVESIKKQVIVCCNGREPTEYAWFIQQLNDWQAKIIHISASEHDRYMGYIQALRHFTTFVYGVYLSEQEVDLDMILQLSSPIYRLELMMVGRLFAQDPELYYDIIMATPANQQIIVDFYNKTKNCLNILEKRDKTKYLNKFKSTSAWFNHYAVDFLTESKNLINNFIQSQTEQQTKDKFNE